jgi:hypothetical protein
MLSVKWVCVVIVTSLAFVLHASQMQGRTKRDHALHGPEKKKAPAGAGASLV